MLAFGRSTLIRDWREILAVSGDKLNLVLSPLVTV
jgi:hypothetical protein